jgi:CubicO group peptidase (beta-lactamase class C family)
MLLSDRGELKLDDPVQKFLPAFRGEDRGAVTIKHLLTHTSGLPDMLPENVELRKRHAPLTEFIEGTYRTPLLFKPGTKVKYQSMGILLASAVAEKITGQPFREFLHKEVFAPLGMKSTSLGLGGRPVSAMAKCQVVEPSDWDWNSQYWRDLAAPWGGAHSTVRDIAIFLEAFSGKGAGPWKPETRREMITLQTAGLNEKWGLGWMRDPARLGKGCSESSFGHWGSTGTVAWHDPEKKLTMVLLTTKPADQSRAGLLGPVSDIVSESR